jgi:hypothetical protein
MTAHIPCGDYSAPVNLRAWSATGSPGVVLLPGGLSSSVVRVMNLTPTADSAVLHNGDLVQVQLHSTESVPSAVPMLLGPVSSSHGTRCSVQWTMSPTSLGALGAQGALRALDDVVQGSASPFGTPLLMHQPIRLVDPEDPKKHLWAASLESGQWFLAREEDATSAGQRPVRITVTCSPT